MILTFNEIEDCFPEHGGMTDDGAIICSAQWLHDFAHAVAAKECEACAIAFDRYKANPNPYLSAGDAEFVQGVIRARSNVDFTGAGTASGGKKGSGS